MEATGREGGKNCNVLCTCINAHETPNHYVLQICTNKNRVRRTREGSVCLSVGKNFMGLQGKETSKAVQGGFLLVW